MMIWRETKLDYFEQMGSWNLQGFDMSSIFTTFHDITWAHFHLNSCKPGLNCLKTATPLQVNNQSSLSSDDVIQLTLTLKMTDYNLADCRNVSHCQQQYGHIQDYVLPDDHAQPTCGIITYKKMSSIFSNSNNQLTAYSQRKHRSMEWRTAQVRIKNFSCNKCYAEKTFCSTHYLVATLCSRIIINIIINGYH